MLDQTIVDRIAASIPAYLSPRDRTLTDSLRAAINKLAASGMIGSGNAGAQLARLGVDELTIRSKIIWNAIQRAHTASGAPLDAATSADLQRQIAHHVSAHSQQVRTIVKDAYPPLNGQIRTTIMTHIDDRISSLTSEILAQLRVEADFYVAELQRQAAQPAPAAPITINAAHIGAVQTGAYAVAHVSMSAQQSARLVEELEALRQALRTSSEATDEQRTQGDEIAGELITAVKAQKPNAPKIAGLLGGLATSVQTIASLRPAWETVRDAAIAAGIAFGLFGG